MHMEINTLVTKSKKAARELAGLSTEEKNEILLAMANKLAEHKEEILEANKKDVAKAKGALGKYMIDRLTLNESRLQGMIDSLQAIVACEDQVGEILSERDLENGLHLVEKRFGMGVVLVIFEARPNVISDVIGLCLKSCCSTILKGGSEALHTLEVLERILKQACPVTDAFQLVTDRELVKPLLSSKLDLVIPRGSEKLIDFVKANTAIPVLAAGKGNCHIYVDDSADQENAIKIILNAKTQRPTVCNAVEKVLVHESIVEEFLPKLKTVLDEKGVTIRGDEQVQKSIECESAREEDWGKEYLDMVLGIKVVASVDEAIEHINKYGSKHSDAILTQDKNSQEAFLNYVDSGCVYVNTSTRFTDGFEFGLGAEIGNSTQKIHARGPLGLKALTTTKFLLIGKGQVRE